MFNVMLAQPMGFCAGVDYAVHILTHVVQHHAPPIYALHEIVHNRSVLEHFKAQGVRFVDYIDAVPDGSCLVFNAHGVPAALYHIAKLKKLRFFDATCPLVHKIHHELKRYGKQRLECIVIGHSSHPEIQASITYNEHLVHVIETKAQAQALSVMSPNRLVYATQTTLSVEETAEIIDILRERCPEIQGPKKEDICYATTNRQHGVIALCAHVEHVVIIGSQNSSNANQLVKTALAYGKEALLVDTAEEIPPDWMQGNMGLSAAASTAKENIQQIIHYLEQKGATIIPMDGVKEEVYFSSPYT